MLSRTMILNQVKQHPCYRVLKEAYPEKLALVENNCWTLCLPDVRSLKDDVVLDEDFFDQHILTINEEGWYRGNKTIVEKQGDILKLVSGPEYQPSFQKGLYCANIVQLEYGVNKSFCQYKMFMLDRPLVPKYTKASLGSISSATSGISSASSKNLSIASQTTVTTVCTVPPKANGSTLSRASSAASLVGRPYQTISDEPKNHRKPRSAPDKSKKPVVANKTTNKKSTKNNKKVKEGQRQWSADSGVDTTFPISSRRNSYENEIDSPFILPPRITSYAESECYLMNLPRCDQFATHLARNLKPLISNELKFPKFTAKANSSTGGGNYCQFENNCKNVIKQFANKLHRLAQESVIAFPRSATTVHNSPRFQEFLRISVENVVVGAVHELVFPAICYLSKKEDRELTTCAEYLLRKTNFGADQLGLPEDFCIPLPAAVVELASLDQSTTPLDRMTCIYDTVQQIGVHIRRAVMETHADTDEIDDLPYPDDREMVLLLATVIVHARPKHLLSTLNYADLFAWAVPSDMIECVTLLNSAIDFVKNVQPKKLLPMSGKLKREVSMEEIIQLTDELSQSFDRHGNRLEPLKSALDLHRERFAQRLERSTADRTRRQEEAWARLDRCPSPICEHPKIKRGLLKTIHNKLICSNDPEEVLEV